MITTSYDKKVKIWDATNGRFVDSFQQNYDKKLSIVLGQRRVGTDEIYSHENQH